MISFSKRQTLRFSAAVVRPWGLVPAQKPAAQIIRIETQDFANVTIGERPVLPVTAQPVPSLEPLPISRHSRRSGQFDKARNCVDKNGEHQHLLRLLIKIRLKIIQSVTRVPSIGVRMKFRDFFMSRHCVEGGLVGNLALQQRRHYHTAKLGHRFHRSPRKPHSPDASAKLHPFSQFLAVAAKFSFGKHFEPIRIDLRAAT